jgi:hypothetical protein
MNVGQHKPVIEMNLGRDAIAFALPNPVDRVLEICGVSLAASRDVFIEVEALNTNTNIPCDPYDITILDEPTWWYVRAVLNRKKLVACYF